MGRVVVVTVEGVGDPKVPKIFPFLGVGLLGDSVMTWRAARERRPWGAGGSAESVLSPSDALAGFWLVPI